MWERKGRASRYARRRRPPANPSCHPPNCPSRIRNALRCGPRPEARQAGQVAARQVPTTRASAPPATGEPAMAAATVPSKVTFGQPTGSCGINAVNATCCTGRAVDGVTLMVKRCAPLRAANPAEGGSTAIARERGSEGFHEMSVVRLDACGTVRRPAVARRQGSGKYESGGARFRRPPRADGCATW